MSFLLFLLILWLLYTLFRPLIRQWVDRRMQRRFTDAFRQATGTPPPPPRQERRGGWSTVGMRRRKKKIDPSVGEYVKYEDITVTETTTNTDSSQTTDYVREQQIVDAEWEDLP